MPVMKNIDFNIRTAIGDMKKVKGLINKGNYNADHNVLSGLIPKIVGLDEQLVRHQVLESGNTIGLSSLSRISENRFTIKLNGITFVAPIEEKLETMGVKGLRFNSSGILLYSGRNTQEHIDQIAKARNTSSVKLVFPNEGQTQKMYAIM